MNILLICKRRTESLRTVKPLLEERGHTCQLYPFESASKTAETIKSASIDSVIVAESAALSGVPQDVPPIYLSTDFFCPERRMPNVYKCLIAHEDLSFDFITHGARDTTVRVCGVPLRESLRRVLPRTECRRALGLSQERPVFLMIGETVSVSVLKSAQRAVRTISPETQTILLGADEARRKNWMGVFSDDPDVFISDLDMDLPIALCAADAVFTPAFSTFVCAAVRQGKIVTLLHSTVARARKNAVFLDQSGAAFHGKTAADSVSYACRLLESDRLRANMTSAQEKTVRPGAEERFIRETET